MHIVVTLNMVTSRDFHAFNRSAPAWPETPPGMGQLSAGECNEIAGASTYCKSDTPRGAGNHVFGRWRPVIVQGAGTTLYYLKGGVG